MPTGTITIKPTDILALEAKQPVYKNKYNGFVYVTRENRNKSGLYGDAGISNRKINIMIKEGYAIQQNDGGIIRTDKCLPDQPTNQLIPPAIQSELEELRQIAVRYAALRDKLFELLEDL